MILTCPECATSYFVDDARIPSGGRSVKCTSCGARWKALPEASDSPAPVEPEAEAAAAPAQPEVTGGVGPEPAPVAEVPFLAPQPELEPFRRPELRAPRAARREGVGKAFAWAVVAVAVVGLVGSAILFRGEVVRLWPQSEAAYAGIGLPVQTLGLVIEGVRVDPTFEAGRPVLAVTGAIRNTKDEAVTAPALRVNLLNRAGQPIAAKIARPLDARVPARGRRHFAIAISDPPSNAHDLEVLFQGDPPQRASTVGVPEPAPSPPASAPAAVDAQPLDPGTQDSLSEHG